MLTATVLVALGVAAYFFTGGYLVYLPLLVILILILACLRFGFAHLRDPHPLSIRKHWRLVLSLGTLAVAVVFYVPVFKMAVTQFAEKQYTENRRTLSLNIKNPEKFRDVALSLYDDLANCPDQQRTIIGNSERLPPEISALNPLVVRARHGYLWVNMCQNRESFFGLLVFPKTTAMQHGDIRITDGLWYWESP